MTGWTECTWIEAANAVAAKTHEAQYWGECSERWLATDTFSNRSKFRIREKARTITVTIPKTVVVERDLFGFGWHGLLLKYKTEDQAQQAFNAIFAAMGQQQ